MANGNTLALLATLCLLLSGCHAQTIAESIAAARNGGAGTTAADTSGTADTTAAGATPAVAATPTVATPSVASALGAGTVSTGAYTAPVAKYLSTTNASYFSISWLAIEAANLADSFNNNDLAITMFVPTNAAWEKRLPTLTKQNNIEAHDLFSVGKADTLRGIIQYHILSTVITSAAKVKGALSTSSNLCSNAKDLKAVQSQGTVQLESAGGTNAYLLSNAIKLGIKGSKTYSTIYPIDDVLLPDVVTIPLQSALQAYDAQTSALSQAVSADAPAIMELDEDAAAGPLAPTFAQPATPTAGVTTAAAGR